MIKSQSLPYLSSNDLIISSLSKVNFKNSKISKSRFRNFQIEANEIINNLHLPKKKNLNPRVIIKDQKSSYQNESNSERIMFHKHYNISSIPPNMSSKFLESNNQQNSLHPYSYRLKSNKPQKSDKSISPDLSQVYKVEVDKVCRIKSKKFSCLNNSKILNAIRHKYDIIDNNTIFIKDYEKLRINNKDFLYFKTSLTKKCENASNNNIDPKNEIKKKSYLFSEYIKERISANNLNKKKRIIFSKNFQRNKEKTDERDNKSKSPPFGNIKKLNISSLMNYRRHEYNKLKETFKDKSNKAAGLMNEILSFLDSSQKNIDKQFKNIN